MTAPILNPLPNYNKFFLDSNNNLFGFLGNHLEPIEISDIKNNEKKLTSFFIADDGMYLTIDSEGESFHYKQKNGIIINIDSVPNKPDQGHAILESTNFKISTYAYDGMTMSKISNLFLKGSAVFLKISGSYETKYGIYFNVLESCLDNKPPALYFFPINRTSVHRVMSRGEIW